MFITCVTFTIHLKFLFFTNPIECQISHLSRGVLSSPLPLRSVGRSNFGKGLHNLITLIKKRHGLMIELLYYIMESTVDSYEKRNTINNMSMKKST